MSCEEKLQATSYNAAESLSLHKRKGRARMMGAAFCVLREMRNQLRVAKIKTGIVADVIDGNAASRKAPFLKP